MRCDPAGLDEAQVRSRVLHLKEAHGYAPSSIRSAVAALRAAAPDLHTQVPERCWREGWWVHWQPAGTGDNLLKYLARYMSRTAISDERIVAATDQNVTFSYTDSATQQRKECTLQADEFMRRYLQHVPPPGQHRVRYFGWYQHESCDGCCVTQLSELGVFVTL